MAVISGATTPGRRVLVSSLGACADETRRERLETPVMLVVGEVVRLRESLDWYTRLAAAGPATSPTAGA